MARQSIAPGYLQTVAAGRLRAREAKLDREARAKLQRDTDERTLQRQLATGIVSALVQGGVNIGSGALKDMWDRAAQERALGAKAAMEQGVVIGPGGEALTAEIGRRLGKADRRPTPPAAVPTPATAPTPAAAAPLIRSRRPEGRTARRQIESTAAPVPTTARTSGVPRGRPDEGSVPRRAVETHPSGDPGTRRARQAVTTLPGQPTQQQPPPQASEPPATRRPASMAAEAAAKKAATSLSELFPRRGREPGYRADITTPEQLAESVAQKRSSIIAALPEEQRQRAQTDYDLATGRRREMLREQATRELDAEYKRRLIRQADVSETSSRETYAANARQIAALNSPVNERSYSGNNSGDTHRNRQTVPVVSDDLLAESFDVAASLNQGKLIKVPAGEGTELRNSPELRSWWRGTLPDDHRATLDRGGLFIAERPWTAAERRASAGARSRATTRTRRPPFGGGVQRPGGSAINAARRAGMEPENVNMPRDFNDPSVIGRRQDSGERTMDPARVAHVAAVLAQDRALVANLSAEERKIIEENRPHMEAYHAALVSGQYDTLTDENLQGSGLYWNTIVNATADRVTPEVARNALVSAEGGVAALGTNIWAMSMGSLDDGAVDGIVDKLAPPDAVGPAGGQRPSSRQPATTAADITGIQGSLNNVRNSVAVARIAKDVFDSHFSGTADVREHTVLGRRLTSAQNKLLPSLNQYARAVTPDDKAEAAGRITAEMQGTADVKERVVQELTAAVDAGIEAKALASLQSRMTALGTAHRASNTHSYDDLVGTLGRLGAQNQDLLQLPGLRSAYDEAPEPQQRHQYVYALQDGSTVSIAPARRRELVGYLVRNNNFMELDERSEDPGQTPLFVSPVYTVEEAEGRGDALNEERLRALALTEDEIAALPVISDLLRPSYREAYVEMRGKWPAIRRAYEIYTRGRLEESPPFEEWFFKAMYPGAGVDFTQESEEDQSSLRINTRQEPETPQERQFAKLNRRARKEQDDLMARRRSRARV